jgi:hypothetical protein
MLIGSKLELEDTVAGRNSGNRGRRNQPVTQGCELTLGLKCFWVARAKDFSKYLLSSVFIIVIIGGYHVCIDFSLPSWPTQQTIDRTLHKATECTKVLGGPCTNYPWSKCHRQQLLRYF